MLSEKGSLPKNRRLNKNQPQCQYSTKTCNMNPLQVQCSNLPAVSEMIGHDPNKVIHWVWFQISLCNTSVGYHSEDGGHCLPFFFVPTTKYSDKSDIPGYHGALFVVDPNSRLPFFMVGEGAAGHRSLKQRVIASQQQKQNECAHAYAQLTFIRLYTIGFPT